MPILYRMMGAVHIDDVNQENICCMNTAIVQFVLADVLGELEGLVTVCCPQDTPVNVSAHLACAMVRVRRSSVRTLIVRLRSRH